MPDLWTRGSGRRIVCTALAGVFVALSWRVAGWAQVVYVNNNIPSPNNSVSALLVSPSGTLTPLAGSPYPTGGGGSSSPNVGSVDITAVGPYLYATNVITNSVAAFTINADGTLTTIPGSPFASVGTRPNGIAINAAGTLLFAADNVSNQVSVFSIASNGALSLVLGAPFSVSPEPVDLEIDSTNSLLFASQHTLGVGVYTIGGGGSLTAIGGSPFAAGTDERGLAVNSAATRLYVADGTNNTVSGFTIGGGGVLTAVTGSPWAAGTGPTSVKFHPTLSVLYAANDTSNDVSAYTIGLSGVLTPLGSSPFASGGVGTAAMAIDAADSLLFAVNGGTNPSPSRDISVFSIDGAGALTPVGGSPFSTGVVSGRPGAIVFSTISRPDCTASAPGVCIPGTGKADTDCVSEWFVDTTPPPNINPRTGLPDQRVSCQNGNAGCDFDSLDDRCTFHVRICINNADPRIACTPTNVASYELLRPRQNATNATDVVNFNQINKAVSGGSCNNDAFRSCLSNSDCLFGGMCTGPAIIGVPFVHRSTVITPGTTNSNSNLCSNTVSIEVPLRSGPSGFQSKSKSFRARIKTSAGVKDTDVLKLICYPAP
jgi:6-phosphogluconolactonase (cycloisomerase 2 family)